MMSDTPFKKVGFIGLGVMGKPMALNLMKAGFSLTVKSRSRGPVDEVVAAGAVEAASPREVAEKSDIVITMLPNSPEVREICLGSGGIIEAAKRGGDRAFPLTVIDMSTIAPNASKEIGASLKAAGIDYLEAPVTGGDIGAIKGTLAIMVGGDRNVFERVDPAFKAMGKSHVLMGGWGTAQTTKLANNIIAATTIEAVAEAVVLVAKAGVDPERMYEAIKGGAAACWSLDMKVPKIVNRDFKPGFMVKLHLKDLKLALDAGKELGVALPVTEKVCAMLQELFDAGLGNDDNCSLVKVIEKLSGIEVKKFNQV